MKKRLIVGLLVLLLAACASSDGPRAGDRYAMVYTGDSRKAEGIFPVRIYQIDGKEISSERQAHRLEPGRHAIKARALVDRNWVPGVSRDLSRGDSQPLEHLFQSGVRYYIGIRADSPRRAEWELVVWKEEPMREGAHTFDD